MGTYDNSSSVRCDSIIMIMKMQMMTFNGYNLNYHLNIPDFKPSQTEMVVTEHVTNLHLN